VQILLQLLAGFINHAINVTNSLTYSEDVAKWISFSCERQNKQKEDVNRVNINFKTQFTQAEKNVRSPITLLTLPLRHHRKQALRLQLPSSVTDP
jgi:hypothetical protein